MIAVHHTGWRLVTIYLSIYTYTNRALSTSFHVNQKNLTVD